MDCKKKMEGQAIRPRDVKSRSHRNDAVHSGPPYAANPPPRASNAKGTAPASGPLPTTKKATKPVPPIANRPDRGAARLAFPRRWDLRDDLKNYYTHPPVVLAVGLAHGL